MQAMDADQRKKYVKEYAARREQLKKEIEKFSKEREKYIEQKKTRSQTNRSQYN